jgi:hypothetical protein
MFRNSGTSLTLNAERENGIPMLDIQLPFDIWLHITSFLSKAELWDIRTLNRVIFDIALDSHYRSVNINLDFCGRRKTSKVFDVWCSGHYLSTSIRFLTWVFSDRNVARRVRTILLSRNAPDSLDLTDIPPASQSWYVYLRRYYQGWTLPRDGDYDTCLQPFQQRFKYAYRNQRFQKFA